MEGTLKLRSRWPPGSTLSSTWLRITFGSALSGSEAVGDAGALQATKLTRIKAARAGTAAAEIRELLFNMTISFHERL